MKRKKIQEKKQRVLIIGFGRTGRLSFAQLFNAKEFDVVAIKDASSPEMIVNLLEYDTKQGKYPSYATFDYTENTLIINGRIIKLYQSDDINEILEQVKEDKIDIVVDSSKYFMGMPKQTAQKYFDANVKRIITTNELGSLVSLKDKNEDFKNTTISCLKEIKGGK